MNDATPHTRVRVSQRPGFVPLKTGDPIPDELRAALNVSAFVRELRQIALSIQPVQQGESTCPTSICK